MDQAGRNTYREGFEAKPCGSGPKPGGVDSRTPGFVLKPIRLALPACGLRLLPQGSKWERMRNHARTDVFGSFPCGNESSPHSNDLHQVVWNQRMQRCAILSHDIESLSIDIESRSIDIGSLSHDNKPFPDCFDSFFYRFNAATTGFRPLTIAFALKSSHLKTLRYYSAPDSCALAADSSFFAQDDIAPANPANRHVRRRFRRDLRHSKNLELTVSRRHSWCGC
jgi:hypothetical protein